MPGGGGGGGKDPVTTVVDTVHETVDEATEPVTEAATTITGAATDIATDVVDHSPNPTEIIVENDPVEAIAEEIPDADELVHDTIQDQAETVIEENIYSLEDAEDKFNENVADVTEDIEQSIDENTDSIVAAADSAQDTASDFGTFVEHTSDFVGDVGELALEGTGALIDINNPNSLITNPVGWYEEAAGVGKGGWDLPKEVEAQGDIYGQLGGYINAIFGPYITSDDDDDTNTMDSDNAMASMKQGLEGDPFGLGGDRRRDILQQRTFSTGKQNNVAPSKINAGGYS